MTTYVQNYVAHASESGPSLNVESAKPRPAGSTWVMFYPKGLSKENQVTHQLTAGFVKFLIGGKANELDFYREKYSEYLQDLSDDMNFAQDYVKRKMVLGSQRALQYGGFPILSKNEKLYNCTASYIDRARVFQEAMYLSLCGCGVGGSVQEHHIAKIPSVSAPTLDSEIVTYQIPDSIKLDSCG